MSPARLPPELLHEVFFNLHPPCEWDRGFCKEALFSCALVCRVWREIARPHVFNAVSVRFWCLPSDASSPQTIQSLERFKDFLVASPHICACVRTLNLRCRPCKTARQFQSAPERIDPHLLLDILSMLPRLQRLVLDGVYLHAPHSVIKRLKLDYLEITGMGRDNQLFSNDLSALTGLFSQIGTLSLVGFFFREDGNGRQVLSPLVESARLARVTAVVDKTCGPVLFYNILNSLDTRHLTSLHLRPECFQSNHSPGWMLTKAFLDSGVGSQLTHVGFDFDHFVDVEYYVNLLLLCPNITCLTVAVSITTGGWCTPLAGTISQNTRRWHKLAKLFLSLPEVNELSMLEMKIQGSLKREIFGETALSGLLVVESALVARFLQYMPDIAISPSSRPFFCEAERRVAVALFPNISRAGCLRV